MGSVRRLVLLLVLPLALGIAACDGDDGGGGSSADARRLLERAFSSSIESGRLQLDAKVQVDGVDSLQDGVRMKLSGPFESHGAVTLPSADFDFSFSGAGQTFAGGLVLTRDNAWVSFGARSFEVGEELVGQVLRDSRKGARGRTTLEDFGVKPAAWVRNPRTDGDADVAGTKTTKVTGEVDALRVIRDVVKIDEQLGSIVGARANRPSEDEVRRMADAVEKSQLDVYVAEDGTLRRITLDVEFKIPEDQRDQVGGANGGSAKIDLSFSDVGEPQTIEPPRNARPLDDLLQQFGLGAESLLQ